MVMHPMAKKLGLAVAVLVMGSGCGGNDALPTGTGVVPEQVSPVDDREPTKIDPVVVVTPIGEKLHQGEPLNLPAPTPTSPTQNPPPSSQTPTQPSEPTCSEAFAGMQFGDSNDDAAYGLTFNDRSVYVVGYQNGTAGGSVEAEGDSVGVLYRLDLAGRSTWRASFETAGTDSARDVVLADDTVVVLGSVGGKLAGSYGGAQDVFLMSVSQKSEAVKDTLQFGGARSENPRRLARAGSDWLLAGRVDPSSSGGTTIEGDSLFASGVLPRDPPAMGLTGSHESATTEHDEYFDVLPANDATHDLFVTGFRRNGLVHEGFVRRLERTGKQVWEQPIPGAWFDAGSALALSPKGELIVAGTTAVKLVDAYGETDAFFAVLDPLTGAIASYAQAGTPLNDTITDVFVDGEGNVFLGGNSDVELAPGKRSTDAIVFGFDAAGTWKMMWQGSTLGLDGVTALTKDACGRLLAVGYTEGELVAPHLGGLDGFVTEVKLTEKP